MVNISNIVLKNKYKIIAMPKTTAKCFDTLKEGDIIEISLPLTWCRSGDNKSLIAYYPRINGVSCSGIPIINKLIEKGMILEEIKESKNGK